MAIGKASSKLESFLLNELNTNDTDCWPSREEAARVVTECIRNVHGPHATISLSVIRRDGRLEGLALPVVAAA